MRLLLIIGFLLVNNILFAQPVTNIFKLVNSAKDESNPVVSPDGKLLFVTVGNHQQNVGGVKDPGDIWVSTLQADGSWSVPVHAGAQLNNMLYNAVAGFSAAGDEMYLLSHYAGTDRPKTQGIAVSKRSGNSWSKPENISILYFQNKASELRGFMNASATVFVFSAETYGSRGVEDIYVTFRDDSGKWGEPKNLGSTINTQFQELSPSLSADGKTLYFSSNGRKGVGSFDIYKSDRLDDTWTNWSEPVNLGPGINTNMWDLSYREFAQTGYAIYTSTKDSDGYGDIKVFRPDQPIPQDSIPRAPRVEPVVTVQPEVVNDGLVAIYGKVQNAKTGESIKATLTFVTSSQQLAVNAATPQGYRARISAQQEYTVRIESNGFVSALEKLNLGVDMRELEMIFKLQPIELGTTVNLRNVLFEQGKTMLLPQSYTELDVVVSFLKANPSVKIELAGHTDNRGIPAQNVKLSQARVDKVKAYLVEKGIDKKRITGKGYGGTKPIASNESEETRQLNRRVEFVVKKV